jgi:hypothetical protein
MANLADLDPSFSVPCRRCSVMLQKWNRFCPSCFEDQFAQRDAADASPPVESGRVVTAAAPRRGRVVIDFEDTAQPDTQEVVQTPAPVGGSLEEADSEIGWVRPGIFNATEVAPAEGHAPGGARFATTRRLAIGVVCALVLVALDVGLGRAYFDVTPDAGRPQVLGPQADEDHAALKPASEPPPQALPEPPADVRPAPSVLPPVPVAAEPAPSGGEAAVGEKACSVALAALGLCPGT